MTWMRCALLAALVVVVSCKYPKVKIEQGYVQGTYMTTERFGREIAAFRGIPYAEPPVGPLRFEEAQPAKPWKGVWNATEFSTYCLQYSHFTQFTEFEIHGSEDCLYLNVYTPKMPKNAGKDKLFNVVIYIHGGAFTFYSGFPYGPEYLLDHDIVLVTINYRLGPLGFLSTEDLVVPGNNGLKDQLMAIKWVKRNIDRFGGDPNKIALAGTSAGGASVHYHVLSPKSKGLFSHGIPMSGSTLNPWPQTEYPLEKAQRLANGLGCPTDNTKAMVECLKGRPAEQIVQRIKMFMPWAYAPYTPFGPVVEPDHAGAFLTKTPLEIIEAGEASDVPLLFSYTADEGLYPGADFMNNHYLQKDLEDNWEEYLPHLLDYNYTIPANRKAKVAAQIREFYVQNKRGPSARPGLIKMIGDRLFYMGIEQAAKLHAKYYSSPSYFYKFAFRGSKRGFNKVHIYDGVSHWDDAAYLFRDVKPLGLIGDDQYSQDMSAYMTQVWYSFITNSIDTNVWPDIKSGLPDIGYFKIVGDQYANYYEKSNFEKTANFWNSLKFKENFRNNQKFNHPEL